MIPIRRPETDLYTQNNFAAREPGLTHPDFPSFIRLTNKGTIEIVADVGLGIVLDPVNKSITFVADNVKIISHDDGFKWNDLSFNARSTTYNEPTFLQYVADDVKSMYAEFENFLED